MTNIVLGTISTVTGKSAIKLSRLGGAPGREAVGRFIHPVVDVGLNVVEFP